MEESIIQLEIKQMLSYIEGIQLNDMCVSLHCAGW